MDAIARQVVATGTDAVRVAGEIVDALASPALRLAFVFADWRLDAQTIARNTQRGLSAPVVGGTALAVVGRGVPHQAIGAVGLGLYGDWVKVGLGVAPELPKSALARSRDAVNQAALALATTASALDPARHVGVTILDGMSGHEEAFCIGSAAAAPQIRMIGGCSASEIGSQASSMIWVNGEVLRDAGAVVLLESERPFEVVTSAHLVPTGIKTVVTAASGRVIHELDGRPAGTRLRELVAGLGDTLDEPRPAHSFARYVDGVPYVRSMLQIETERLHLACAVEAGHVLRLMRPGDLIGTTRRDLASAAQRVGGTVAALLAFSCTGRHWEAHARGIEGELEEAYAAYPTVGLQTSGEQSGMLLVNHTLTGLAIGAARERGADR